jgi:hypothetical protein
MDGSKVKKDTGLDTLREREREREKSSTTINNRTIKYYLIECKE